MSTSPSLKEAIAAFLSKANTSTSTSTSHENPASAPTADPIPTLEQTINDWCISNRFQFPPTCTVVYPELLLQNTPSLDDARIISDMFVTCDSGGVETCDNDGGINEFNERGFRPTIVGSRSGIGIGIGFGHIDRILLSQCNPWLDELDVGAVTFTSTPTLGIETRTPVTQNQKRRYLQAQKGDVCFPVPHTTVGGESSIDIANLYLWPLLHSRANDVIACRTFGQWKRLFESTIHLAFPSYHNVRSVLKRASSSRTWYMPLWEKTIYTSFVNHVNPELALYLISVKSNFWPYGRTGSTGSSISSGISGGSKWIWSAGSSTPKTKHVYALSGASKDRTAVGLCELKKRKENEEDTEIEWLISSDFLRRMKRVHIYIEQTASGGGGSSSVGGGGGGGMGCDNLL